MTNAPDLHVHSTFSTFDGFGSPKAVVERAIELGWGAVCLTEHGWMGSAPFLYQEAKKAGIKPILGCEMYVTPSESLIDGDKTVSADTRHLTVLALSKEGYQNLVTWVNASYTRPAFYGKPRISFDKMIDTAPHPLRHNVILSGCMGGELCQCLVHYNHPAMYAAVSWIEAAKSAFPNFYIELQNHGLDKFLGRGLTNYESMVKTQGRVRERLIDLGAKLGVPLIVTNDSHYQSSRQRKAHVAMLARKQWRRGRETHEGETSDSVADSFAAQYAYWTNYMREMEGIADTLPSSVGREAIQSIHDIVEEANIVLEPLDKFSYTIPRSGYDDPVAEIRRRSKSRLKSVVSRHGQAAQERFDYELAAMADFAEYLCIEADVAKMCRDSGIYTWTRGSAANSLVAFCLKIHEIDPIHYKLIFERFVNPARAKFPDIDMDIEGHRQQDVARMVGEYMAEREPEGGVLPVCTYSTVANRAAFRLAAEAAGLEKERVDELAKLLPQMIDSGMATDEEEAYEILKDEFPELHEMADHFFDSVANVSQHACAFALGTNERPLSQWVPSYLLAKNDVTVTQFNMKGIEEMGYLKLDLLKLKTLAIMHDIARMLGHDIDWLDDILATAPGIYDEQDEATYDLLRSGRTEGVHSFQGGTQRRGCIEVKPETDHDMVAIQALYRPSGTRTGYDKQFVNRRFGREDWQAINDLHGEFTNETYGFPIYQEQIMEMAFAMGMTGEEVDDLYKAIKTAKGAGRGAKELFDDFEPTFRKYADKLMPRDEANDLWAQWHAMQGYTFNRGHAASYAILGLKCAYLKAHYPQEYYAVLLDHYPKNPRYLAAAIADGFRFEQPDVNASGGGFSRGSDDKAIRIGLSRIKSVGPAAVSAIIRNQPFASVEDLRNRTPGTAVKAPTIDALRAVGALETLGISGDEDDETDFKLMEFVPRRPVAFKGCKPKILPTGSTQWRFDGLNRSVDITQGKAFCAKLFWIPESAELVTKTSATGKYDAHLLTVVDENGIPFDLSVATDKKAQADLVKLLHKFGRGSVVCAEGQVSMPFLRGGNTQFKLWGIAGAEAGKPQMWHLADAEEMEGFVIHLAGEKRRQRKRPE